MNRAELARSIVERALLRGQFVLRSGTTSSTYWDKYRFESDPGLLRVIADELVRLLPASFDKLAGLELGGIPLATAVALTTGRPQLFVRKQAKTYGTANLVEGGFVPGEVAVVVEDVVTSGGQVVDSVEQLRALGLVVQNAICVIDREQGGRQRLAQIGCSLAAAFTISEIERLTAESGAPADPPTPTA